MTIKQATTIVYDALNDYDNVDSTEEAWTMITELIENTRAMRSLQKRYFATRKDEVLLESKKFEKLVDNQLNNNKLF